MEYLEEAFALKFVAKNWLLKNDSYSSRDTPKPYNPNFARDSPEKLALLDVLLCEFASAWPSRSTFLGFLCIF